MINSLGADVAPLVQLTCICRPKQNNYGYCNDNLTPEGNGCTCEERDTTGNHMTNRWQPIWTPPIYMCSETLFVLNYFIIHCLPSLLLKDGPLRVYISIVIIYGIRYTSSIFNNVCISNRCKLYTSWPWFICFIYSSCRHDCAIQCEAVNAQC